LLENAPGRVAAVLLTCVIAIALIFVLWRS
jgi:hypothetical protein